MGEFAWLVAVAGEDAPQVAGVELSVTSLGGPEPVLDVVALGLHREWRQWVQTFEADTPISDEAPVTVSLTLSDAEAQAVDTVGASGGTGTVYKAEGFGKGTKLTASETSAKPQLL